MTRRTTRMGALVLGAVLTAATCASRADEVPARLAPPSVVYAYDEVGRLRSVSQVDGDTATYAYDPGGNLVAIDRRPSDELSIVQLTPVRASPGETVTVHGTGFGSSAEDVAVTVAGTPARVVEATPFALTVEVPDDATTGPVEVTVDGATASSQPPTADPDGAGAGSAGDEAGAGALAVVPGTAPTVDAVEPAVVAAGDSVTITGEGFAGDPAIDTVVFDGATYGTVTEASEGRLVARVPATATTGPVSVATPEGTGTSDADLVVAPPTVDAAAVASAARVEPGESVVATVDEPGDVAVVAFPATRGQRVAVELADSEFPACALGVGLVAPGGVELARAGGFGQAQSRASCSGEGPTVAAAPVTGTYTLALAATATSPDATGSVRVEVTTGEGRSASSGAVAVAARMADRAGAGAAGAFATPGGVVDGDGRAPVDLASGTLGVTATDLVVDDLLPASVERTYQHGDPTVRAFGVGTPLAYDMALEKGVGNQSLTLVLPNGLGLRYERVTEGTGQDDAVFRHTATPTALYGSQVTWNGAGWDLGLPDGTTLAFAATTTLRDPLVAVRDTAGNQVAVHRRRDRNGVPSGRVASVHTATGRTIAFRWEGDRIAEAADDRGRTVAYGYDAGGRLATVTDPLGAVTRYGYDRGGRLATVAWPGGGELAVSYDGAGRVARQARPGGGAYAFAYEEDGEGRVTTATVTDPRGSVRRVQFDDGYWTTDTAAVGTPAEQATTVEREGGRRLVTAVTAPGGDRTEYAYDASGRPTAMVEHAGTDAEAATQLAYEGASPLVAGVTDPLGRTTAFGYDAAGRLAEVVAPDGARSRWSYDEAGRLVAATDPAGATTSADYELGHRVTATGPGGGTVAEFRPAAGTAVVTDDAIGNRSTARLDPLGRHVAIVDPAGGTVAVDYDEAGEVAALTDPNGNRTAWARDPLGRVTVRTDPLGTADRHTYDEAGNLTSTTDRRGVTSTFEYDPLGRQVRAAFGVPTGGGSPESTIEFAYDDAGRLVSATDSAGGSLTRDYDEAGLTRSETSDDGSVAWAFDEAGQRTSRSAVPGEIVSYHHDEGGRLVRLGTSDDHQVAIRYDDNGRPSTLRLPNDVEADYGWDAAGRLAGIDYRAGGEALGGVGYRYDPAGRRASVAGGLATTSLPEPVRAGSVTYGPGNRLVRWGDAELAYDDAGNLTSDGESTYTWDARGQLAAVDGPVAATFAYDAVGRRTGVTVDGAATTYGYDGPNVATAHHDGDEAASTFLTGLAPDELFARLDHDRSSGPQATTFVTDGLGTALGLFGADGLATTYAHEPYGATTASGANDPNPFGFTGRERDPTGLHHHRARYYDPGTGRFLSEDPLGLAAGDPNLYRYVGGDPVNAVDPTGLCGIDLAVESFAVLADFQSTLGPGGRLAVDQAADPFSQEYLAAVDDYLASMQRQLDIALISSCAMAAATALPGALATGGLAATTPSRTLGTGPAVGRLAPGTASVTDDAGAAAARALGRPALPRSSLPTPSQAEDIVRNATPVGSALKQDPYHYLPVFMVDEIHNTGSVYRVISGDQVERTLVQLPGEVNGVTGRFEWIIDENGLLTHQVFVKGETVNGVPLGG